jgi:hypothetical protein
LQVPKFSPFLFLFWNFSLFWSPSASYEAIHQSWYSVHWVSRYCQQSEKLVFLFFQCFTQCSILL